MNGDPGSRQYVSGAMKKVVAVVKLISRNLQLFLGNSKFYTIIKLYF